MTVPHGMPTACIKGDWAQTFTNLVPFTSVYFNLVDLHPCLCSLGAVFQRNCQTYPPRTEKRSGDRQTKTIGYLGWQRAPLPAAPDPDRMPIQFRQSCQR